ncbi:unnamed protein product [Lactuca virosa]|uniref:Uncharacterized protein n=1 Tax=Lactuca virosa TaxID=75947 RepID=A0AAU9NSJ6_9ASTR|nr:unnamed protein product [Lactuca virosa]
MSRLCYWRLWGSRNRRAVIFGCACYLDAFNSYPLRTWLSNVYRGHDNWYTKATTLPLGTVGSLRPTFIPARWGGLVVKLPSAFALEGQSPSGPSKALHSSVTFWEAYTHKNCLPETVPWPVRPDRRLEFYLFQSSISLMAQTPHPEGGLLCLPPKMHRKRPKPIPGKSEAS